jgi:hypothetical protein
MDTINRPILLHDVKREIFGLPPKISKKRSASNIIK